MSLVLAPVFRGRSVGEDVERSGILSGKLDCGESNWAAQIFGAGANLWKPFLVADLLTSVRGALDGVPATQS